MEDGKFRMKERLIVSEWLSGSREYTDLEEKIAEALRLARKEAFSEAADIAECKIYVTDDCNEICRMIAAAIRTAGENG